jgi:acyl-CoA reductase-like NAD-dependent aldehyde dehydrogenase
LLAVAVAVAEAGAAVAADTTKDKVRGLLGWQLNGICFSAVTRLINELRVGTLNIGGSAGYRIELTPFGGIKALGLGYKEGVQEAMKSFANLKTLSLP